MRWIKGFRSSPPEVFLGKGVLETCSKFTGEHPCWSVIFSKFTGEHPCRSVISITLLCNFIDITLRHGCSPVNLLNIFRTHFYKNNSRGLPLGFLREQYLWNFQSPWRNIKNQPPEVFCKNRCSQKFLKIHRKARVSDSDTGVFLWVLWSF